MGSLCALIACALLLFAGDSRAGDGPRGSLDAGTGGTSFLHEATSAAYTLVAVESEDLDCAAFVVAGDSNAAGFTTQLPVALVSHSLPVWVIQVDGTGGLMHEPVFDDGTTATAWANFANAWWAAEGPTLFLYGAAHTGSGLTTGFGSGLTEDSTNSWKVTGDRYADMINLLDGSPFDHCLRGVILNVGLVDAYFHVDTATFQTALDTFATTVYSTLGVDTLALPVSVPDGYDEGEVEHCPAPPSNPGESYRNQILSAQVAAAAGNTHLFLGSSTDDLAYEDCWHFKDVATFGTTIFGDVDGLGWAD